MRDPLEELRSLTRDLPAAPLPADEVRRRGDRLRRRRTLTQALGAAAAVVVVVSGAALMSGDLGTAPVPPGPAEQTSSPAPSPTAAPQPAWLTSIPDDFPIERGLPEPGGDVPEWTWAEGAGTQLSAIACGQGEHLPAAPVDGLRVAVAPPDSSAWRHLLLFEGAAAAAQAKDALLSSAGRCTEGTQGVPDDQLGPEEVRWTFDQAARGRASVLDVEGMLYARGTDVRVPGRVLTRVIRVGNALLVARLDTASSATGADAEVREFDSDLEDLAAEMCVFAAERCGAGPAPESSSPSAASGESTTLTDEQLLVAQEIPFTSRFSFVDSGSTEGPVSRCAQGSLADLGATSVLRRYFVVPGRPIETRTAVAEFPDEETARTAYARIQDWIGSCPATLREDGFDRASLVDARFTPALRTPGARGVFAELDYGPAPTAIDPRGEMGWFQSEGTVRVGRRLTWLSLSAVDVEWHFSLDPQFTDLPLHPFHTAMPRAAQRLAAE